MAQGEYVGKRITATIPQETYDKLVEDARINGIKPSTRAAQLIALYYNQQGQVITSAPAPVQKNDLKKETTLFGTGGLSLGDND